MTPTGIGALPAAGRPAGEAASTHRVLAPVCVPDPLRAGATALPKPLSPLSVREPP